MSDQTPAPNRAWSLLPLRVGRRAVMVRVSTAVSKAAAYAGHLVPRAHRLTVLPAAPEARRRPTATLAVHVGAPNRAPRAGGRDARFRSTRSGTGWDVQSWLLSAC